MKNLKISEVVLDYSLYPRTEVDSQQVSYLAEAMVSGTNIDPIVINSSDNRCIDGFHRVKAYRKIFGDNHVISAIEKKYGSERELFLDAIRYNAKHGRMLTTHDRTHCALKAQSLQISVDEIASVLHTTVEKINRLTTQNVAKCSLTSEYKPIKKTIRHMSGQVLNKQQWEVNDKLSGLNQTFYINQVIMLIESGLLDTKNDKVIAKIKHLRELLFKMNL